MFLKVSEYDNMAYASNYNKMYTHDEDDTEFDVLESEEAIINEEELDEIQEEEELYEERYSDDEREEELYEENDLDEIGFNEEERDLDEEADEEEMDLDGEVGEEEMDLGEETIIDKPFSCEQMPRTAGDFSPYFSNTTEALIFCWMQKHSICMVASFVNLNNNLVHIMLFFISYASI